MADFDTRPENPAKINDTKTIEERDLKQKELIL
jgi:hypothetical protein